jgi:glutamate-1-semialdehyde 2,1-aminomutase
VVKAVTEACQDGLTFGAPTEREYLLAKLINEIMPSMELTRLVSSGTEAVMSAIRVARGYTNRDMIIKFRGCYHGHSDGLLVKAGSGALTGAMPDSKGVPVDYTKNTLIADYNNKVSVERLVEQYSNRIAAIIVEPVAANMGVVIPKDGFLPFLRDITTKNGSLLIFDEVITGFRLGLGGAQEYYGVTPDLTTLGKIIGGGMPVGAYGGKKEIMELVAPVGGVYQAGTLSGNPIATAAGIQTLTTLKNTPALYDKIEKQTNKLVQAVRDKFGKTVQINHIGSLMCVFFTDQKVVDFDSAITSNTEKYADYFGYLLDHGIYQAPSQFEAMFISYAHSEEEIEKTCEVIKNYPNVKIL